MADDALPLKLAIVVQGPHPDGVPRVLYEAPIGEVAADKAESYAERFAVYAREYLSALEE